MELHGIEEDDTGGTSSAEDADLPFPGFQRIAVRWLPQTHPLRYTCLRMITNPWFERISILVILINCVTLGMYRPCEDDAKCDTPRCQVLQKLDDFIFGFFTIELLIKMIAMGIVGRGAYFNDRWNWLDCFIVFSGVAEYCIQTEGNVNLTAIRTIRVLRPLRAINRIPSMRILVMLLLDTLPMLGNVLLLCFFVFFIFGIIGVQLWAGTLRQRCFIDLPSGTTTEEIDTLKQLKQFYTVRVPNLQQPLSAYYRLNDNPDRDYICSLTKDNGLHTCHDLPPLRTKLNYDCTFDALPGSPNLSNDTHCINWNKYYTNCRAGEKNPFQGAISFDNIGLAWVAIFLVISLEGWTDIMYYVQDAHSFWDWIYFVLLIVIGSFFMINLCLVVIATQFSETKKRELERMRIERARFTSNSTLTAIEHASCYSEIIKLIAHSIRKLKMKAKRKFTRNEENTIDLGQVRGNKDSIKIEQESGPRSTAFTCPQLLAISGALGALPQVALGTSPVSGLPDWGALISSLRKAQPISISAPVLTVTTPMDSPNNRDLRSHHHHASNNADRSLSSSSSDIFSISHRPTEELGPCRAKVRELVESKLFQQGILCAILINTFSMGVEHHLQPDWLTTMVEMCNFIFSGMFFLEMLLKLTAYGFVGYVSNGFDVFDGTIVILSAVEICQKLFSGDIHGASGGGALSVLRTFRLLRILKLVRFLPNLRRQLVVMLKTMDNVATFFGLLVLFIFIFSILGMNLFGCKFCADAINLQGKLVKVCDRKNFDSLLWALVTVFQVLTQEDWNIVLFNGMERTSPWAALYFVALMTFGNYVLFNLLVAILVEGFSSERIEREQKEREAEARAAVRAAKALEYYGDNPKALEALESPPPPVPPGCSSNLRPAPVIITHTAATPEVNQMGSPHPPSVTSSRVNLNHINVNIRIPKEALSAQLSNSSLNSSYYLHPSQTDLGLGMIHSRMSPNSLSPYSLSPPSLSPQTLSPLSSPKRSPCLKRAKSWREDREQRRKERRCSLSPNLKMNDHSNHNNNNIHASWCESRCASLAGTPPSPSLVGSVKITPFKRSCQDALHWLRGRSEYSCFLFGPETKFRQRCHAIVEYPAFDRFILLLIALNCITLAMERPSIPPNSGEKYFLLVSNDIFTVMFLCEMSIKVVAVGGFQQYFKSGWNVMDGILVIVSVVDQIISVFMSSPRIFGILRVFRLLRSLRPLRVINRAPGLKLVVQTLLSSLRPIGNIVLICCTFFIIFGILGVQLFKGKFFYCFGSVESVRNVTNRWDCKSNDPQNKWINQKYNFDDLGQALMSLFVLASKDGWVGIMYSGLDATEVDKQPIENENEWRLLYFISFLLLVGFFVLNMFVGVVVENFHRCREEQEKEERVRRAAKRARKMEKRRRKMREPPYWSHFASWRIRIHRLVTSKYFDLAIAGVIGLNVVTMAMEFYMMPEELDYILKVFNYFFTSVFMLELAFKLLALGWKRYFKSKWNQLDIFIVILSIAGIILEKMESDFIPINPTIMRVMRVLRIARVLKLLKMASGIRALLDTVVQALPQVGNLGLLFFLLFFIFAALGVELFGRLLCDDEHPCEGLGEHANFENFGMAFLTLFRVATGDNWNGIMKDTLRDECDATPECFRNCCVSKFIAPLFFVVFVLMAQFVLVNVVVAVLMKHLEESHKAMEDDLDIEAELEAELAAQEEIMAKLVDDIQDTDDPESNNPPKFIRLPKVTSLPNSFVFTYFDDD
ncbi:voltage-dependent T-type calcium channel subunit alpha-1G isoform X3 [Folsomia candida]|uniref:voltage-dependent T-type calcium channel subunit alpha-1G isoform X3 n=1 Tax=Folsomia candida TaxID=158441 RepID=UPI0016054CDA|nr:voltage-dependent T-type calcium channel subunit alpha-1G isoform X3 [Folsomia candida]